MLSELKSWILTRRGVRTPNSARKGRRLTGRGEAGTSLVSNDREINSKGRDGGDNQQARMDISSISIGDVDGISRCRQFTIDSATERKAKRHS